MKLRQRNKQPLLFISIRKTIVLRMPGIKQQIDKMKQLLAPDAWQGKEKQPQKQNRCQRLSKSFYVGYPRGLLSRAPQTSNYVS